MSKSIEIKVKSFAEELPISGHLILYFARRGFDYRVTCSICEIGNFVVSSDIDPKIKGTFGFFTPYFECDPLPVKETDYWTYLKDLRAVKV